MLFRVPREGVMTKVDPTPVANEHIMTLIMMVGMEESNMVVGLQPPSSCVAEYGEMNKKK